MSQREIRGYMAPEQRISVSFPKLSFIFRKKIMRFRADRKAERAAHQARMRMRQTAMQSPVVQSPAIQNQTIPDATPKNFETHGDIVQNNEPHQN